MCVCVWGGGGGLELVFVLFCFFKKKCVCVIRPDLFTHRKLLFFLSFFHFVHPPLFFSFFSFIFVVVIYEFELVMA